MQLIRLDTRACFECRAMAAGGGGRMGVPAALQLQCRRHEAWEPEIPDPGRPLGGLKVPPRMIGVEDVQDASIRPVCTARPRHPNRSFLPQICSISDHRSCVHAERTRLARWPTALRLHSQAPPMPREAKGPQVLLLSSFSTHYAAAIVQHPLPIGYRSAPITLWLSISIHCHPGDCCTTALLCRLPCRIPVKQKVSSYLLPPNSVSPLPEGWPTQLCQSL